MESVDATPYNSRMRPEFFLFLAAYFALVLLAGLAFSRRMKSLEDFFLASRGLSAGLVFLSLTASWFGATSILVSTDEAMKAGLGAFWIMGAPAVLTVLFLAFFLARPLQLLPIMTIPDLVELRYGRLVRHLASGLIIWYMVLLAASQMVALGQFLRLFLGISYVAGLGMATAVVLVYSMTGGLRSVVFTDIVQFVLLVAGTGGLVIWLGGRGKAVADIAARSGKERYFDLFHNFGENGLIAVSFILAWTISPIALQRIQAARGLGEARKGLFAAAGMLFLLYAGVTFVGMAALPLFSGETLSHPLISEVIASKAGLWFGGVLFMAVLAAVLSTLDTAINTGALSLNRDVFNQLLPSSRISPVAAGRLATLILGLLAFLVATRFQSILKTLGLSSEIMAEGLFVPGLAMIFSKRRAPAAGLLSLGLGGGYALLSFLGAIDVLPLGLPVWPYSVPYGLALSLAGYVVGRAWSFYSGRFRL